MSTAQAEAPPKNREEAAARAKALFPYVRGLALDAERDRHLPAAFVEALVGAGLVRTQVPRRWGGTELGLNAHTDIAIELGRAYGSAGWVGSFLIDHPLFLAHFPEQAQNDVWGAEGPDALIATSFIPVGQVTPEPGGFRVSGDWPWASGVAHCGWIMLGGLIFPPGADHPEYRLFLMPTSEIDVVDTWYSAGLRGSGSDNVVVSDVFVPEHRTLVLATAREGQSPGGAVNATSAMYEAPLMAYAGHAMTAPAIGIARGVAEAWLEHARAKAHSYTQEQVGGAIPMQLVLGEAMTRIDCAEMLVRRCLDQVESGAAITLEDRVRNRRDITYATNLLSAATNALQQMAGASALRDESPIQRGWRDVQAVSCHVFCNFNAAAENYGRMAFGLELNPKDPFF
jgi:3-hydroxy-9,10-secoandrosta-1,3,5(10)-triene-9,17-dione monooxygenase